MDGHFVLTLDSTPTNFSEIQAYLAQFGNIALTPEATANIECCRNYIDEKIARSETPYYGINTGFGYLQHVSIEKHSIEALQENLLKSHACGLGNEVPEPIVRLMLMLKVKSLTYGYSGVQLSTVQRLVDMHNQHILPVVYEQGSLGASGDLSPLSHLSLPLIGIGEVNTLQRKKMPAADALQQNNWQPITLESKEGLALINGTQFMNGYGLYTLNLAYQLYEWANVIAALSVDAFACVYDAFSPLIQKIRPHKGQIHTAAQVRQWLDGSALGNTTKPQVQDPYSFRCIPQVHGASWDVFEQVKQVFETELNSVTDNPNVFVDEDEILSGGNFHGQPLALHLDFLAIALSELGSISERRIFQLISGNRNLPPFLIAEPGLHSGYMIPQYTAASIASQNKQLCTPASVDSIPSSNNQEDHVSMGANAAVKCFAVAKNVQKILAIELMNAVQALEFRKPILTSPQLQKIIEAYHKLVPYLDNDRFLQPDILNSIHFIQQSPTSYL